MSNGLEQFENWRTGEGYKTAFTGTDIIGGGFIWARLGSLDLSTNVFTDDVDFSPYAGDVAVLLINTVIGAASSNPNITIGYTGGDALNHNPVVQVTPGMQPSTSISIPLVSPMRDVFFMVSDIIASGIVEVWSPHSNIEHFDSTYGVTTVWSPASPGL